MDTYSTLPGFKIRNILWVYICRLVVFTVKLGNKTDVFLHKIYIYVYIISGKNFNNDDNQKKITVFRVT